MLLIRTYKVRHYIKKFDAIFSRIERRISTAKKRGEQVYWKNYRPWYSKYIGEIRHILNEIHKFIGADMALNNSFKALRQALEPILDINSSTTDKYSSIPIVKEKWDFFKKELEDKIRAEYDVFPLRSFDVDEKLCFVLMPFTKPFKLLYTKVIKPVVTKCGLKCRKADDIFGPKPIMHDVWRHINMARIIIADLTGRNTNVFYEVGIAHTLAKRVILLTQSEEDVPFDIKHIRHIAYTNDSKGRKKLKVELSKSIREILRS
jgi:hypothetical protein